ncbi:hypothetical protein AB0F17_15065 [Nonomuraea sp. NPDC026600]|uniref:hypothetical protein n=1 Tax=Nonomuraea sp. NPDC026600 TaxID=3155363 RepID=UPI0033D176AA
MARKLLSVTAIAGLVPATVGTTAASATVQTSPSAYLTDRHGNVCHNKIIVCDRSTHHRYAMAKVRYQEHPYQYVNAYKNQDCVEWTTRHMSHGKIELWACVSVKFGYCGAEKTVVRP